MRNSFFIAASSSLVRSFTPYRLQTRKSSWINDHLTVMPFDVVSDEQRDHRKRSFLLSVRLLPTGSFDDLSDHSVQIRFRRVTDYEWQTRFSKSSLSLEK